MYVNSKSKSEIMTNLIAGNFTCATGYLGTGAGVTIEVGDNYIKATSKNSALIEFIGLNGVVKYSMIGTVAYYVPSPNDGYIRVRTTDAVTPPSSPTPYAWGQPILIN